MKPGDVIPSNSVIIPADVAKEIATHFRKVNAGPNSRNEKWADLLDPQSLREQVADCVTGYPEVRLEQADLVLKVVADWLAAQPPVKDLQPGWSATSTQQRDHDVRLLRGES